MRLKTRVKIRAQIDPARQIANPAGTSKAIAGIGVVLPLNPNQFAARACNGAGTSAGTARV